jgi:hypothetical protein
MGPQKVRHESWYGSIPDGKPHGQIETMLVGYDREGEILNIVKGKIKLALEHSQRCKPSV